MAKVVIYTTAYCPYCDMAKALFLRKQVAFENVDVTSDAEKRAWLAETTGQRTVPQIFINDKPIGGFDELSALQRTGKLDPLLSEPGA